MRIRKVRGFAIPVLAVAAMTLGSCASMDQRLMLAPIVADYPVSASPALLVGDRVIKAEELTTVKAFKHEMLIPVKITQKRFDLDLSKDLIALIRDNGGQAITELKITTKDVRNGSIGWISFERYMGIVSLAVGGSVAYIASSQSMGTSTSQDKDLLNGIMLGSLGVGGAFIGGSFLHQSLAKASYSLEIEGKVVTY